MRRRCPRIGVLLVAFAVLPLTGAGGFAAAELRAASETSRMVEETDPLAQELIRLTDLRTRLLDEYNWSTVAVGLTSVGIPSALIAGISGVDIASELAAAISDVDALRAEVGFDSMSEQLTELRVLGSEATMETTRERDLVAHFADEYEVLDAQIVARSGEVFDQLAEIAGSVPGGERLLTALRTLQLAAEARQTIASQTIGYFITQFTDVVLQDLIEQHAAFVRSSSEIERLAPPGSRVAVALAAIDESGDTTNFVTAVDEFIDQRVIQGAGAQDVVVDDVLGRLDDVARSYETGSRGADAHLTLLDAAAADIVDAESELLGQADADRTRAQTIILGLVAIVALLATLLTRALVRPLRQLAASARLLMEGETDPAAESRGPVEVREANDAIREAADHLKLVQEQATALAEGDLDNPILAQQAPSRLGRSLQAAVTTLASSMSENESYRIQLAHDATHDPLTQLPNRRASLAQLEQALARSQRGETTLAVLFIDLDGFKAVNDQLGHLAGDVVLQAIAGRMQSAIRDSDHVGRFGGDEFVVIAQPIDGERGAIELGQRLTDAIEGPIEIGETTISVGASIGIFLPGDDDLTPDEILHSADLAAYRAKRAHHR